MIVCGTIPALHPVLRFIRHALGILQSKVSISQSRKTATKLSSGEDTELSSLTHMRIRTKTTVERGPMRENEGSDPLVDGTSPRGSDVKVEMAYDVKHDPYYK